MGKSTINGIIDEACYAFWDSVAVFVNIPRTAYDWMRKYFKDLMTIIGNIWSNPTALERYMISISNESAFFI